MTDRVTLLRTKEADRAELEAAMRRFQSGGGQIQHFEIQPHREQYLAANLRAFAPEVAITVRAGKRQEAASKPHYTPSIRAFRIKAEERA